MKTLPLLCATALTAVSLSVTPLMAEEKKNTGDNTKVENAKTDEMVKSQETIQKVDVEDQKTFLETLYNAQIALHNKKAKEAQNYIQAAMDQLGKIKTSEIEVRETIKRTNMDSAERVNSADKGAYVPSKHPTNKDKTTEMKDAKALSDATEMEKEQAYNDIYKGRKVLEVEFGSTIMPEKAVMPISNGSVTTKAITDALTIEGLKSEEIKDVNVRYIAQTMDREEISEQLIQARNELQKEDFYGAQYDLLQIQRSMLEDGDDVIPAQTRARDNIALTRYLVKAESYDAARETLDEAEAALDDMEDSQEDGNTRVAGHVTKIKGEIESLDKVIEKRDPTMFDKIDNQLKSWWNDLS